MFKKIKLRSLLANSWVLLFLAVLIAGGLTYLLYKYLNDRENKLKADIAAHGVRAGIEVVVPARDVPVGTPLTSDDFVAREIAADLVYDDMIRADDFQQYRAAHLVKAVRRGLPLRAGDVDALRGRDFSDALPAGQRAVTIEIDTVNSTALLIRPGNRVDLYWLGKAYHENQANDEKKVAQLLMPNLLVLATGQDMRARDAGEAAQPDQANANSSAMSRQEGMGYTTITLQVPVDEVARVALAQKIGGLRLILRNAEDKGDAGPQLVQESEVFTDPSQGNRATGGRPPQLVEMIAGGGSNGASVLMPQGSPSGNAADTARPATNAADTTQATQPSPALPQRQPSLYEQANAIAQQLQTAVATGTSKQN